jgi:carboxymethylenebutenolidase
MGTRTESVAVEDGAFDLTIWVPERGHGPGMLLLQEIFGVGAYIRGVGADLAALGYVVAAPDMFWRMQPGWAPENNEEGLKRSMEMVSHFDGQAGMTDLEAALDRLTSLPEVSGGTGAIGFCFGGSLAYALAARAKLACMVSYYGSQVPGSLELIESIDCPAQFHFGGSDPYISRDQVAAVERAVADRPDMEIHVQEDGGHAFHNRESALFYQPEPAARAWRLTEDFLARRLPA